MPPAFLELVVRLCIFHNPMLGAGDRVRRKGSEEIGEVVSVTVSVKFAVELKIDETQVAKRPMNSGACKNIARN